MTINTNPLLFEANLDTYGDNSGSAVFNRTTREVEGILVRGNNDYVADTTNSCWRSNTVADNTANTDGEDVTRTTIPNFQAQVPRTVFVDSSNTGPEGGSRTQPFNTLNEGLNSIQSDGGVALVLHPGQYQGKVTIHTSMRIYNGQVRSGAVRIGQ